MLSAIAPLLLFIAFLLLLLVSLSLPIIKSIYLFQLAANIREGVGIVSASAVGRVRFGVWGYCISAVKLSALGQSIDATEGRCSKVRLGYKVDSTVADALHVSDITNIFSRTLTAALVLHPIACGLTFLTFLFSLGLLFRRSTGTRLMSAVTLITALLAALFTTIAFLIDVILVALVRTRVKNATDGEVQGNWGPAVWMTLGATIAIWASTVGACMGMCGRRRKQDETRY